MPPSSCATSTTMTREMQPSGLKRWKAIFGTILPALVVLNLVETSRECNSSFITLLNIETPLEPPQHHPLMLQMLEKSTAVVPLDAYWTKTHKNPKRKNTSWINGDVGEQRPLPREVDQKCVPVKKWANSYHPNCSVIHEVGLDIGYLVDTSGLDTARVVGYGSNRDVWAVREYDGTRRVLKTVKIVKKFNDMSLFDRNRRDAVASEQLSASPYVMSIYGHCGYSALYDFSHGGELSDVHESNPTKDDLLRIAHDVATSVADAHHVDERGRATIAHTDIKPAQFLKVNGRYMLNDFNRCRFLYWNRKRNRPCAFQLKSNGSGVWRAPEEYLLQPETEKIDVFSLGNVLYFLLTGKEPFLDKMSSLDAIELIKKGKHVSITDDDILSSTHPFDTTTLKALDMCFVYDPKKRSSAREVANLFRRAIGELESLT